MGARPGRWRQRPRRLRRSRRRWPSSRSTPTSSSTNSGLPSAAPTMRPATASGTSGAEQPSHQRVPVGLRERLQQQRGRVQLPAGPTRPRVQKLGPGHAQEQDRDVREPVGEVVDQVEQWRLGPVDVVEGHDERPARRHRPEQVTQRDTRVLDTGVCARQAEQRPDPVGHLVGDAGLDQRLQPRAHVLGRVALVDAGERLHRLGQRPVRHALAVGEAAARADRGRRLEPRQELRDQARLAHARGAEHGHELARALLGRPVERVLEHPSLAHAADEGRRCRAGPAGEVVVQRDHAIRRDGVGLPLQVERLDRVGDDRPVHEPVGGRADQDLAHRRGLLEPRRGVHRVAGRDRVGRRRGADDHLARGDADAHVEPHSEPSTGGRRRARGRPRAPRPPPGRSEGHRPRAPPARRTARRRRRR